MREQFFTCQEISGAVEWRALLARLPDRPLYSSEGWGRYKSGEGWSIRRLAVFDASERLAALAQVQEKRLTPFGGKLALVQGGPAFVCEAPLDDEIIAVLEILEQTVAPGLFGLLVIQPMQATSEGLSRALTNARYSAVPATDADTIKLALTADDAVMMKGLSRFWKRNLKKARSSGLIVRPLAPDDVRWDKGMQTIASMYSDLASRKGFDQALDPVRLGAALKNDPAFEVIEVFEGDTPVAVRAVYHGGACTLDLLAAATPRGHETAASYLAMWTLINSAAQKGARYFDAGGIDPENNPGVYRFKAGLGGDEVEVGRLWVKAWPSFLTPYAVRYLARRQGG